MGRQVKLSRNKIMIKRRKFRRRRRSIKKREVPFSFILQELYDASKSVFLGPAIVPSTSDVQCLCKILDKMELDDLGLNKNLQFFNPLVNAVDNKDARVTYTNVYKCKNFSLVLFFLPASTVIPLHNHPDMTVFTKLLFGQIHVKSYDLADFENGKHQPGLWLARQNANTVYTTPCETKVLYPKTGGNIHELTAIKPSVILDVLSPPYSKEDDRDCTYYRDYPYDVNQGSWKAKNDDDKYGWLEEIEMPEDLRMDGIRYLGPRIIEKML